jgi:hypothetical protein
VLRLDRCATGRKPGPAQDQHEGDRATNTEPLVQYHHTQERCHDRVDVGDDRGSGCSGMPNQVEHQQHCRGSADQSEHRDGNQGRGRGHRSRKRRYGRDE